MDYNQQPRHSQTVEHTSPAAGGSSRVNWLRDEAREARETQDTLATPVSATLDFPLETQGLSPYEADLANGNRVKVVFGKFWESLRRQDRREGARPSQYYAIKVYSNDGNLSRRMTVYSEFRGGEDFNARAVCKLWDWLQVVMEPRRFAEFESLADFTERLEEEMCQLSDMGEDAFEHFQHLPQICDPKAFDHEDDSIYNDQNELDPPRRD